MVGTLRNTQSPAVAKNDKETAATPPASVAAKRGYFNFGKALFNSAFIVLCIIAFESLVVYFAKDYLAISVIYPAVGFTLGFLPFIVCAILYASGYKANTKCKKRAPYILSAIITLIISVIMVTMLAVYMKAQVSLLPELLTHIVIPVAYLLNILFFAVFFRAFSVKFSKK